MILEEIKLENTLINLNKKNMQMMSLIHARQAAKEGKIIALRADNREFFLYYDRLRILIPVNQYPKMRLCDSFYNNRISKNIGSHSCVLDLILSANANEVFSKLNQIKELEHLEITEKLWFINDGFTIPHSLYNGATGKNIPYADWKYAYELRVSYISGSYTLDVLARYGLKPYDLLTYKYEKYPEPEPPIDDGREEPRTPSDDNIVEAETLAETLDDNIEEAETSQPVKPPSPEPVKSEIQSLLDCDKIRCGLPSYESAILYDIKAGHWDVFENPEQYKEAEKTIVPRDPKKDIRKSGVIGIDFGTKSTVVVKQENSNEIRPLRIGSLSLDVDVKEHEYENPTVISCLNLTNFLSKYLEKKGRPETSCNDFFVSYNAYEEYKDCSTDNFYAYYSDLKQWANLEKDDALVQDRDNKDKFYLREVCSLDEKSINPIELYAYYIGMYINNMRNGIYMKYVMSFPVKYSKATKELIRSSFERGLKKSLPQSIIDDAELMKTFSVTYQISEPAAYAVTALERSGFQPENENEKYLYGIFDFGGGTTDFDFGIWRGASEEEYDKYNCDYVLECFGADSDVHLGGENILEMLAYEVFKENKKMAAEKKITCAIPVGQDPFIGSENLISRSQAAYRNLTILKEAFRPLWEQHENWEQKYSGNKENTDGTKQSIEIQLYDLNGNAVPNCKFEVNTQHLLDLIKKRIQQGVDAFFKCIEKTMLEYEKVQQSSEKIYIFLAGNSCKSIFVKELFEEAIQKHNAEYNEIAQKKQNYFELFAPLTSEDSDSRYVPNAKTSVAYGLVKSRPGGNIRVIKNNETNAEEETRFKYYLGTGRKGRFVCKLAPMVKDENGQNIPAYNIWTKFQGAGNGVAKIYYTENPTADSNPPSMDINEIPFHEICFEPDEEKYLFIRAVKPTVIEYAVASSKDEIMKDVQELHIEQ